jgi:hypothetical protein
MAGSDARPSTVPNFRTARLFGIFNVLFATELLVCGLCMGGYTLSLPLWGRAMARLQSQMDQQAESAKKASLDALADQEKLAKTDAEKAEIEAKRKELEAKPNVNPAGMMDFSKLGMDDPQIIKWSMIEVITGVILNVMMLAAGIGLMSWKPWSRQLGVWTAVLKITRLVLLYGFFIIVIVPIFSEKIGQAVGEMMVAQQQSIGRGPGAMPPTSMFVRIYTITYSAMGVGIMALGVIYPAISLWYLTRPGVKVACSNLYKLPKEPRQPW